MFAYMFRRKIRSVPSSLGASEVNNNTVQREERIRENEKPVLGEVKSEDWQEMDWSSGAVIEATCPLAEPLIEVPRNNDTFLSHFLDAPPELLNQFMTEATRQTVCSSIRYCYNKNFSSTFVFFCIPRNENFEKNKLQSYRELISRLKKC